MARPRTISDAEILSIARACIVDHGPGVSLSTMATRVGLTPGGLVKRFGTKEQLVFRALLPTRPPSWVAILGEPPPKDVERALAQVLMALSAEFSEVGPAFAALRMSGHPVSEAFGDGPSPFVTVRQRLSAWLSEAGLGGDVEAIADAAVGASEARGFASWIGGEWAVATDDEAWAAALAALLTRSIDV